MPWLLAPHRIMAGVFSTALSRSNATLSNKLAQPIPSGLIVECFVIVMLALIGLAQGRV